MRFSRSTLRRYAPLTAAALSVLVLTGCGGGNGGSSSAAAPPPAAASVPTVPQSAYASIDAFISYLRNLPTSETAEPLNTGKGTPPTSETAEPTQIN